MDETAAQKLYERMVALEERARELDHHLRTVQDQLGTLAATRDAIIQLQALPEATETWIPIAPGAFVKGTVSPAATVLLSVGASVAVEKSPEAIMATLQGHEDALTDVADQGLAELKEVFAEMDSIKSQVDTVDTNTPKKHAHDHAHDHSHHSH